MRLPEGTWYFHIPIIFPMGGPNRLFKHRQGVYLEYLLKVLPHFSHGFSHFSHGFSRGSRIPTALARLKRQASAHPPLSQSPLTKRGICQAAEAGPSGCCSRRRRYLFWRWKSWENARKMMIWLEFWWNFNGIYEQYYGQMMDFGGTWIHWSFMTCKWESI